MQDPIVTSISRSEAGVEEFKFRYKGKEYKVVPKPNQQDKLAKFLSYVKVICPKNKLSPFAYSKWQQYFDIEGAPGQSKPKPKPDAEQLSIFARKVATRFIQI